MKKNDHQRIILLLQFATICVFLGRAWQHLVWDAPFRTLLWDEGLMKSFIEYCFSMPWQTYITSPEIDAMIQGLIKNTGWFYLICAIMAMFINKWKKIAGVFMILGSLSLILLAMLYCKERFFSIGQFFEYALQFLTPLFLYFTVKKGFVTSRLLFYMKLAIAFTFVCHGLYAIGYYPRPGYFIEMTLNILNIEEDLAIKFLSFAGIMDFIIGIGIFLPFRYAKWIIIYAIIWGFFTTIARVWAYIELDYFIETSKQFIHESIYRVPHFVVPFVVYKLMKDEV